MEAFCWMRPYINTRLITSLLLVVLFGIGSAVVAQDSKLSKSIDAASIEYFLRGSEKIDGQINTIYEVITGRRFARGSGPWQTSYYKSSYWISTDGRIRKYVGESDALMTKRNRTTEVYEYDSKIKIEAPIK